jgi:hypothetical protein
MCMNLFSLNFISVGVYANPNTRLVNEVLNPYKLTLTHSNTHLQLREGEYIENFVYLNDV